MREQRYYLILVVVVLRLGAAAPGAAQDPAVVFISALQGRLEGVMVEKRGEGVLVEAEAARHVSYVASWGCPTLANLLVSHMTLAQQLERFGRIELFCNCCKL